MNETIVSNHPATLSDDANTSNLTAEIRKLRARGMSVSRISQLLNEDEFVVARICGVSLWRGRDTRTMERAT